MFTTVNQIQGYICDETRDFVHWLGPSNCTAQVSVIIRCALTTRHSQYRETRTILIKLQLQHEKNIFYYYIIFYSYRNELSNVY